MQAKLVLLHVCVVPLDKAEANSKKWIGMEGLNRDCGVKMKKFLHRSRNPLLFFHLFPLNALIKAAIWYSRVYVYMVMFYPN